MKALSTGQRKLLGEFLVNFAIVWLAGAVVSPMLTGTFSTKSLQPESIAGIITATVLLLMAFITVKEVES